MLFRIEANNVHIDRDSKTFEFDTHIVWFNGYFRIQRSFFFKKIAAEYILGLSLDNNLESNIQYCNGVFTCIILNKKTNQLTICNDRFGFGQMFFVLHENHILLSNNIWNLAKEIDAPKLNKSAVNELLTCRFVFGGHTLVETIEEVLPASIYNFSFNNDSIYQSRVEYWNFQYKPIPTTEAEAERQTFEKLNSIMKVFSEGIIKEGTVGLNLTGGIDSRLLLKLLLDNISGKKINSYTFGDKNSSDINIASQVAKIGKIEHSPSLFENPFLDFFNTKTIDKLTETVGHSCYYFQAYGVSKLVPKYKNTDYLITGADGFFVGLMMNDKLLSCDNPELLTDYIYKANASILSDDQIKLIHNKENSHSQIKQKIRSIVDSYSGDEISTFFDWTIKHRLRKYILAIYDVLNKNTLMLLPFYDYEFIDFMAELPFEQLQNQKAYVNAMCKFAFVNDFSNLKSIEIEKRKIIEENNNFKLIIKSNNLAQKIINKLFALPEKKSTYRAYKTYRKDKVKVLSLLKKSLELNSDIIDKDAVFELIKNNSRNEHFFMYELPVILSLARFENKLNKLNK